MIRIKKGLDLPIIGSPKQSSISKAKASTTVALTGPDYVGMKPSMLVQEGETVKLGQKLFECKKNPGVFYTSPAAGTVRKIHRGARRAFETMVIQADHSGDQVTFETYTGKSIATLTETEARDLLIESGLWTAIRERPFDKTPAVDSKAEAIFVSATDTNPLAAEPARIITERKQDFQSGMGVLAKLTQGTVFLVQKSGESLPSINLANVKTETADGIHPAGNVGTHMHFLCPAHSNRRVWHVGYQDVLAIGQLFTTGNLNVERVISLAGPRAKNPRLLRTHLGANLDELIDKEIENPKDTRVISGSVFNGRKLEGQFHYLGRYHNQVTLIEEDEKREFLGWQMPGANKFSIKRVFVSSLLAGKKFAMGSNTNGSPRAIVPIGSFEDITSLDILPTQLLRALMSRDTDGAQELGCLEFAEEDLAIYTFASPGKIDFGPVLRENLDMIEREG